MVRTTITGEEMDFGQKKFSVKRSPDSLPQKQVLANAHNVNGNLFPWKLPTAISNASSDE